MPLPFLDMGASDDDFASVLRDETRGGSLVATGRGGWLKVSRPFPDLAISVDPNGMTQIRGHGTQIEHTISIDHLRFLWETGKPITNSSLKSGVIVSAEGLATLGRAFILGDEFYENDFLRRIPQARSGMRIVAFCPQALRKSAEELIDAIDWIRQKVCLRSLQRFIIHHELGHFFMDPQLQLDDSRFHDAFASHLAFGALADQDSKDIAQAFSVLRQTADYNYYLLLNNFDGTRGIMKRALEGDLQSAKERFYAAIASQPLIGTTNGRLRVVGDIVGWPGFGAKGPVAVCSGEVIGVANFRDGTIVAARIRIIDGFFPESVRIFANEVGTMTKTVERCGVVRVIPKDQLDISELVRSNANFEEIIKACETRHMPRLTEVLPPLAYNVCLPCRCGVFVITVEVTQGPDSVDVGRVRAATCDRCGFEVEHRGEGIAFLAIDSNRNLAWHSRGGSSALERQIRATGAWLRDAMPPQVLSRLSAAREATRE